jgi:hypothetical protein
MTIATLVKSVRDPRSGEVDLPREEVTVMNVIRNLDRTLLKVRWPTVAECVVFPDELEESCQVEEVDDAFSVDANRSRFQIVLCYPAARWSSRAWVISTWRGIPIRV